MNKGCFAWLALGLIFLLSFALGYRGLNEPDEGRYANIAREMLEGEHGFLDPVMSDLHHYDKPPLLYWTTAAGIKLLGWSEWVARLPSLMGALMALFGVGWAAWRLYGERVAWWTLLVCGTMLQFWALARWLTPDMFLAGWTTLAVAAWVECRHREGDWRYWGLSLLFWTGAWWTKATPALVPLLGLVVALWVCDDRRGKKALRWPLLLLSVILLGAPWYVFMMERHHELVSFFFGRELAGRVTGHVDGRHGPFYYYLMVSLAAWLPWWPWVVGVSWKNGKAGMGGWIRQLRQSPESVLVLVGLVVFSSASSKLPTYTLPLAPWAALAMARLLVSGMEKFPGVKRGILATAVCWAVLLGAAAVAVVPYESSLGRNSSLREVARQLKAQGADRVFSDRYWPGLEVYFGENVHYLVGEGPIQLASDQPEDGEHFKDRSDFLSHLPDEEREGSWLLHYRNENWPLPRPAGYSITVGDFELVPLVDCRH